MISVMWQRVVFIGICLVSVLIVVHYSDFGCQNEAPAEHVSPDGQWKYVSFDRNCGTRPGSNLQITVLPTNTPLPHEAANAFIADDNPSATKFVAQPQGRSERKVPVSYS